MKTSVVLSTYNGEKYLVEQLDSIKNQTLSADEVVICDDCSNDNTVEIVRKIGRASCRERVSHQV